MIEEISKNQIKKVLKDALFFVSSGLLFIFVAKASMNIGLFKTNFFSILFIESVFLLISFFVFIFFFSKIKNILVSYILHFIVFGLASVFFVEYLYNNNRDFAFFVFLFLFILKGLQLTFARLSIDTSVSRDIKSDFIKRLFLLYFAYIFIGLLGFFAFSSINIWSFGFVFLLILLFFSFAFFLFRIKYPKKIKVTKVPYKDVSFY